MRRLCLVLIILFLISHVNCLHFQRIPVKHMAAQSQLQALKAQQASFENQVNNLITNITSIESKFKASNSTSDRIITLENAIISERETVFELSNSLIPPFNLSKNACQELTNQQKINLLDQVNKAKQQISKIKTLALSVPPCDQLKMINSDITKQGVLIDSIEKIIYTKCDSSIILSPTIFQSNIYASNWILGNQTIDDLIEQYYQRSIQYDNITNCPLEYPFFDGKSCISCNQDDSVFNMFTKKCDFCSFDTQINTGLRKCQQIPHYSNYNGSYKYNLDGANGLPTPDPKLTPCDKKTPFWNGTCINCKNGKWWSVKDSVCKSCPAGKAFDINLKSCIAPTGAPYLTILEGTQWVSSLGNLTNVLKERATFINGSQAQIQYCSSDSPYFDGLQCISCDNQFDLAKLKCSSAPTNSSYDDNLHAYTPKLSNKETNVKASNILSSNLIVNSSVPDCDISTPYYDGITCIFCQQPFILFDNEKKKCVACQADQIYNNVTNKCDKRNTILISTNFNNLLATQSKSIEQYKKQLLDKVTSNKEEIIDNCKDAKQYSNYSSCFSCRPTEYFNVETKKCVTCNGTMNSTTSLCIPKNTLITNLSSTPNLLLTDKKTLDNLTKQQSQIIGPIQVCPKNSPYAVQGVSCIACSSPSIYFDLKQQKCVACPINSFYNNISMICQQGIFVSNLTALTKYIQVDNYTVANLKNQINQLNKTKPLIICPQATPFFDGSKCSACPNNTYVNLKNFSCSSPVVVANVNALNELDNVFQENNYTVDNIAVNISKITQPTIACDVAKPAFNGTDCYSCPSNQYYKLKTNKCVEGVTVTNAAELKKIKNIKQTDNYTLANIQKAINTSSLPTFPCDESRPLFNGNKCIKCDVYQLYDLKQLVCIPPQMYTNTSALKNLKYLQLGNNTINSTDLANANIMNPKKPCPPQSPLFNKFICISCPNGTYYNLQALNCTAPTTVTNVDAIRKLNNFLETDNYTLANIKQNSSKVVLPTVPCDPLKPLYNGTTCIECSNNSLYSIKNSTCVTCRTQDYYNMTTNKCTSKPNYYPNLNNNNWIVGNASIDKTLNFTKSRKNLNNSIPCPSNASFFNNNTLNCQSCPNATYFSYDTFNCTPCGVNQQVDPNTHQCAIKMPNGSFQTSLNSNNLIYNGISKGQLQDSYSRNKTAYPNIRDCPQNKPYFDGFDCISCHPSIQYFNLETQRCQNCGTEGAVYDNQIHDCVKQNQVVNASPNPAKMYSSIF